MYGGLFGDLPAAKNESKKTDDEDSHRVKVKQEPASVPAPASGEKDSADQKSIEPNNKKPRVTEESKGAKSVAQKVGVAGTSMAFVPTHLKRKRNPAKKPTPLSSKNSGSKSTTPSVATKTITNLAPSQPQPTMSKFAVTHEEITIQKDEVINPHPSLPYNRTTTELKESEELQKLHDNVTDPYDPMVPNDLLQYWERQAAILERQEMERQARETLEQQNRVREQLERERMELLNSGDINALASRGRGRGVANIPAWLVEKQKKEAQMGKPEGA